MAPRVSLLLAALLLTGCAGDSARAPALDLRNLDGEQVDPFAQRHAATVFIFARTDCPISNRYAPTIRRLAQRFASSDVALRLVYLDRDQPAEEVRQHLAEFDYGVEALADPHHTLVRRTGATITPEAAVFDADGRLVYRGRIDDRYVDFGKARQSATRHDVREAVEALLRGEVVSGPFTQAVGCYIADLQ